MNWTYSHAKSEPTANMPGKTGPVSDGLPPCVDVGELVFEGAEDLPEGVEFARYDGYTIWRESRKEIPAMNPGFTPGPWRFDGEEVLSGDGCPVAAVYGTQPRLNPSNDRNQCQANARLIASATELYAIAQAIYTLDKMGLWPKDSAMQGLAGDARAALAKAEGRA